MNRAVTADLDPERRALLFNERVAKVSPNTGPDSLKYPSRATLGNGKAVLAVHNWRVWRSIEALSLKLIADPDGSVGPAVEEKKEAGAPSPRLALLGEFLLGGGIEIGKQPVTEELWREVMDLPPRLGRPPGAVNGDWGLDLKPVLNARYEDIIGPDGFLERLRRLGYGDFRLPTREEWITFRPSGFGIGKTVLGVTLTSNPPFRLDEFIRYPPYAEPHIFSISLGIDGFSVGQIFAWIGQPAFYDRPRIFRLVKNAG